ncbi:Smg protein [Natronocella acetinitrilica]|jgi:Smg protein|uniref:Protein Smg homolog n=1 Tax=Natronocella acetinitrilica TaxID=414046 RepID=A0AAE3KEP5_9GAMM|nr:DUF494 domain-containing protein [Natronocella acetinitrilica]MCP1673312.1 Smg protein [Natronocella acetinitrilica]
MKENVFDVLMYLFENYIYDDEPQPDRESLESELFEAGFQQLEIRKAFTWLDDLARSRELPTTAIDNSQAIRVFTDEEQSKIDTDTQGFLLYLEQAGVVTATSRELIIDRLMALDDEEIDPDLVRWVTLMVLYNQPGQEEAYAWMENLLFDSPVHLVH